jgi:hypothetical protein
MARCDSARLKLGRARQHIGGFKRAWRRFVTQGDPYGADTDINPTRTCITFRLAVRRPIPPRFGLIIGDCVTNLRATLDHVAFNLPRAPSTPPRWERTSQFPICDNPADYARRVGNDLLGVDPATSARLEALQPYYGGADPMTHPLRVLRELANLDKHRQLHVVALVPQESRFEVTPPPVGATWGVLTSGGLESGGIVGKVYYSQPAPRPSPPITLSMRFGVTIGGIEPLWGVEYALEGMHRYIRDDFLPVVESFIP